MGISRWFLVLAAALTFSVPVLAMDTVVWSVDTSRLTWAELEALKQRPGITDWAELGDRLLIVGDASVPEQLRQALLRFEQVEKLANLGGVSLVLSKYSGAQQLLAERGRTVVHEGPFFLIKPEPTAMNRLRKEEDHFFRIVPLASHAVVFRSAAHLAPVAAADPQLATIVDKLDRSSFETMLKKLIGFLTRYSYPAGILQAADWALAQFKSFGLTARIDPYSSRGKQLPNVVAELKGSSRPDEIFVVGAHLDSIGYDSATLAPGADDNGSGSAAVLEMARVLAGRAPAATIRFVLWSGEEQGLYGSSAFVKKLEKDGELSKVKAVINLDMVAFDPSAPLEVMLEGQQISHPLSDRLQAHAAAFAPNLQVNRTDNAWGSDHMPFLDRDVPATLTIEFEYDNNGNEHSPRDVFDICNLDLAMAILRMDTGALAELAGIEP
ncbi:MAG: Zn-dependent exopeptidase M28 [Candidatus Riflebacteria bacterium]|nr:Zn-dependent exopeptidase M28 [Candidatus Riflebacteria bacterium]